MDVSRRNFISTTAGALLATGTGACASLAAVAKIAADRVGVCSWSFRQPLDRVAAGMKDLGISRIHLALQPFLEGDSRHGAAEGAAALAKVKARLASGEWKLSAAMCGFPQEDYSTLESIRRTGGIVPDACWETNRGIVERAAKLAGDLKAPYLSLHAGFLDESSPVAYGTYRDRVLEMAEICAKNGTGLILESGQETAEDLAKFMARTPGVGINFDPANMILYGKGDPVAAVKILAPWIRHVHVKDAVKTSTPGTWGEEKPWGEGEVDQAAFLGALAAAGYGGAFAVEREGGDNRPADIALAVKRLLGA